MNKLTVNLNACSTIHGPLPGEVRARIMHALREPSEQAWHDIHALIVAPPVVTIWQAVIAADPSYAGVRAPRNGQVAGWTRVPPPALIAAALAPANLGRACIRVQPY